MRILTRRRSRPNPALRSAVRAGAAACIVAAVAVPLIRRRKPIPAPVTVAACVSGPLAMTVLWPRSKKRDVALFTLQMWGFVMVHELPYDNPESLRRRLKVAYPIAVDRLIGAGTLPNVRLQRMLRRPGPATGLDRALTWAHWLWFLEPHASLLTILIRDNDRFPRAARQMAATYDIGTAIYYAVPTAPPWWAAQQGMAGGEVHRVMVEVGEETWGRFWKVLYGSFGNNPWAAMPSLHFATSLMAAIHLAESGTAEGIFGWGYALTLGFALVYLGEHYVTDLAAGATLVGAVRIGEPLVEPLVVRVNRGLQRLERIAAG